jgi:hypothetical protein
MQPVSHEEALVRAFIKPEKRRQYLDRLASPKTRQKFMTQHFHHMADLDERAERLHPHMPLVEFAKRAEAHNERIYEELRRRGAPDECYVMSASSVLDGQQVALRDALDDVVGWHDGTFISCIPGKLAYFEGEELNERYILERPCARGTLPNARTGDLGRTRDLF